MSDKIFKCSYENWNEFLLALVLLKDKVYPEASKSFTDAPFNDPPYTREECILLKAFKNMPHFEIPAYSTSPAERIFELRSYESATEAKAIKKIEMFNDGGEISLFASLKFNAVFFGEVLSGSHMPNLIYMTSFSDMKAHDEHWKEFGSSSEWNSPFTPATRASSVISATARASVTIRVPASRARASRMSTSGRPPPQPMCWITWPRGAGLA